MDLKNREDVRKIVQGCVRGDRNSQHLLYKMTYGKMLGVCMRYSSDINEAKDLLHDGYLKVFEKISTFKNTGHIESWMKTLIVNNNLDYIKSKNKINFNEYSENFIDNIKDDTDEVLEQINETDISAERLVELIQELSPVYRTIFNLYYIEDLSHKEIAEMLNISIGTSKSNLARAKNNLKNLYIQKYGNIYE
ncbi:MAG: sigma-70 family RNA polymerase sigma factor [Bacteroidales bacterium]|jgi:RNA polymerase sigma-70 factor (ECF subfamily)|nr:sigma-70 family RNA polymerase sigma factor [Bacteroidales bacterium]